MALIDHAADARAIDYAELLPAVLNAPLISNARRVMLSNSISVVVENGKLPTSVPAPVLTFTVYNARLSAP